MTSLSYPPEILRLTVGNPFASRLEAASATAERRSPICGSRVIVDINLDKAGRVSELGMKVNACAFGQAAAHVFALSAVGKSPEQLADVRDRFAAWLGGEGARPEWPGIDNFPPDNLNTVRRAAVQLAFQAAAEAAEQAATLRKAA